MFEDLLKENKDKFRQIWQIHIHHSQKPDYSDFNGHNHIDLYYQIKNWHVKHNGWSDIGYHFLVFPDGHILKGRSLLRTPASIKGHNRGAVAICMIGNFDIDDITKEQYRNTIILTAEVKKMYDVPLDKIYFHRDWNNHKTCPGLKIQKHLFIEDLKKEM